MRLQRDLREEFWRLLGLAEYDNWTHKQFADHLGVGTTSIFTWRRNAPWDEIKAARRKRYAEKTVEVDSALLKAAKAGDVAAIKLWFERFDSYTPEARIVLAARADEDLKARADELAGILYANREGGIGRDLPGTGEARA